MEVEHYKNRKSSIHHIKNYSKYVVVKNDDIKKTTGILTVAKKIILFIKNRKT